MDHRRGKEFLGPPVYRPRVDRSLDQMIERLRERLFELASFADRTVIPIEGFEIGQGDRFEPIHVGEPWPVRDTVRLFWRGRIPAALEGEPVHLSIDPGGEALLLLDGRAFAGLDPFHREVRLFPRGDGRTFELEIEAVPYGLFGTPIERPRLREAALIGPDADVRALVFDLEVAIEAAAALAKVGREGPAQQIADLVSEAFAAVSLPREPTGPYLSRLAWAGRRQAMDHAGATQAAYLGRGLYERHRFEEALARIGDADRERLVSARAAFAERIHALLAEVAPEGTLVAVGHAHIDLAWLWPFAETRRKARRTFATVLHLMDRYPAFRFVQSMAQLYAWVEEDDPELFARVAARVAEGRWEIAGGMWVEADGNLPAGEAWVRQLRVGQRYFEERFGRRAAVAWLPDTFGYAANLPQLLRSAGLTSFFSIKLNWSETTTFPFDLYRWQGIDGSEVIAHSIRNEDGYNGVLGPARTLETWLSFRGRRRHPRSLFTYGHGDGGGGPTFEMLERADRQAAFPALPRIEHGSVASMFAGVDRDRLPTWAGEQYLEYHRGTYTSQASLKRLDRAVTTALVEAEVADTLAHVLLGRASERASIDGAWRALLRNQFHDILPGSAIRTVVVESEGELLAALALAEGVRARSLAALAGEIGSGAPAVVVFNLSLDERRIAFRLPRAELAGSDLRLVDAEGAEVPWQEDGDAIVAASPRTVPGLGYVALAIERGASSRRPCVIARPDRLENEALAVRIAEDGTLASVVDKRWGREVLEDRGNQIWAYADVPRKYDAWDIDVSYPAEGREVRASGRPSVVSDGPLVGRVRVVRSLGAATILQTYRLDAHAERLEIETEIDWTGRRTMLRALFPLAIRTHEAWFETAFGAVPRPTHANMLHDAARFEVAAHRFADLSEAGYGVSLLNDGKYGHSARGGTLGITLLRSPIFPDPYADEGRHRFVYALHPHAGDWRTSTLREAHDLNAPLRAVPADGAGSWPRSRRFLAVSERSLRLSALELTGRPDEVSLRLYEAHGGRGVAGLASELSIAEWKATDLLGDAAGAVPPSGRLAFGPFQVITLLGRVDR
jgi:alpha-mannosidase